MSQLPNELGYFTHLLNSNPHQYSASLNQSNPSTPGSQNSNSSSQPKFCNGSSVETSSAGGSQSESVSSLVSQDYRRKCDAAEIAYEAKREKEVAMMECRELEFLMLGPSSLPPEKRAIIERKQTAIMRKYPNADV
ncbi:hypothetical protein Tco_1523757 [Tanacetum coccineum]